VSHATHRLRQGRAQFLIRSIGDVAAREPSAPFHTDSILSARLGDSRIEPH